MGVVWRARDDDLRRDVAIKVLAPRFAEDPRALSRFLAEAQITSQLDHPNIVPIYELGTTDRGEFFIVMKLARGQTLRDILRDSPAWSLPRLLRTLLQVCQGVDSAHQRGVVHRDLKPGNVMLGEHGEVLVLDWGVAALRRTGDNEVERDSGYVTREGTILGTLGYMAPEQASGQVATLTPAADVWSLGVMLYEILTGRRPYPETELGPLVAAMRRGPPPDPREAAPAPVPEALATLAMRCLALDPTERPADAGAVAAALTDHLDGITRRARGRQHLERARAAMDEAARAEERAVGAARRADQLEERLPNGSTWEEREPLVLERQAADDARLDARKARARALSEAQQALLAAPDTSEARELLLEHLWSDLLAAEGARDTPAAALACERLEAWADDSWAVRLEGRGRVSLITEPPGAMVTARQVDTSRIPWAPGDPKPLGVTPLESVPLGMGSWLLTLEAPGREAVDYPVLIERCGHWEGPPVPLPALGALPAGVVYVPPGPFQCGGDEELVDSLPASRPHVDGFVIQRLPITLADYFAFLDALPYDEAVARAPRALMAKVPMFPPPEPGEPWRMPTHDRRGNPYDPQWPAAAFSPEDAVAYAAWRAERDGIPWRLPSELEWEKAARGVDGRPWPWGDRFEPSLARVRDARPGHPLPVPVGSFPHDRSVYGVLDLAGNVRDWCAEVRPGSPAMQLSRGGYFQSTHHLCRLTRRSWASTTLTNHYVSVRLAASWPPETP